MSQDTPTIPTKKPTNIATLKNIPLLKDMNNGSPYIEAQEKEPDYSKFMLTRTQSALKEIKPDIYKNLINSHKNGYDPDTNEEALENINKVKDYKWKIGMILIDRINSLKNEIREKRKQIENKKKEFEKKNVYKERIIYLKKLIKKEEAELYPQEYNTNSILKEKKKDLESEVTMMEANSNTVVSSLEMILLAVDNIYEKCAKKSAWTQHGDLKEFSKYDNNDKDKKKLYQKRVQEAKMKIKYINSYIQDYVKITEDYKKMKKQQANNK
jgi:predicted ATPase with chaperone activity